MTSQTQFAATEEEEQLAAQVFVFKDCHATGVLNADAAIDVFKRSGLSFDILRDIWTVSDKNRSGDLSREELTVALRLMGWAQAGEALHEGLLQKQGPLPTLDGISDVVRRSVAIPNLPLQIPRIKPEDVRDYSRVFTSTGAVDGYLEGDKVMVAFMTSNLSYEQLRKIHLLVDKSQRGALEFREFALAMHLIHALQSSYIYTVPSSIPRDLQQQFAELELPEDGPPLPSRPSHHSKPSLRVNPSTPSGSHLPPTHSRSRSPLPKPTDRQDEWDVTPQQKREFDSYFHKLDLERKGYVDEETAAKFMLAYQLPAGDLSHIWGLVDLNRDDHLTIDEFAMAMHLIQRKANGEELPTTLPPSLIPPSLRSQFVPKPPPTSVKSPINKAKPPPPPLPKREWSTLNGQGSISSRSRSISHIVPPVPANSKYSTPYSPPISPKPSRLRSRASSFIPPSTFGTGPAPGAISELSSPFEDPEPQSSHLPPSRHHSPPAPSPSPRPPDTSNNEALEEFKKETARLSVQVESLLSQLTAQSKLREANENLRNENDSLTSQLRDMERTVSEVLSASDLNGPQDQYTQEITRLSAELANKESQVEDAERMVAVLTQDSQELRASLREAQAATAKAKAEADELRQTVATQKQEIDDLTGRVADMNKAMAEPNPASNIRQLQMVARDMTKENEKLKGQLRDTQKSMEQLLLSTKFNAHDELDRENRRLKEHIQELEILATSTQSSQDGNNRLPKSNSDPRAMENLSRENDRLNALLRDGQRAFADFRSASETKAVEMQQQIDSLTHERNRLKIDAQSSRRTRSQEDNAVPPPAYDDSFVVPPTE